MLFEEWQWHTERRRELVTNGTVGLVERWLITVCTLAARNTHQTDTGAWWSVTPFTGSVPWNRRHLNPGSSGFSVLPAGMWASALQDSTSWSRHVGLSTRTTQHQGYLCRRSTLSGCHRFSPEMIFGYLQCSFARAISHNYSPEAIYDPFSWLAWQANLKEIIWIQSKAAGTICFCLLIWF